MQRDIFASLPYSFYTNAFESKGLNAIELVC